MRPIKTTETQFHLLEVSGFLASLEYLGNLDIQCGRLSEAERRLPASDGTYTVQFSTIPTTPYHL